MAPPAATTERQCVIRGIAAGTQCSRVTAPDCHRPLAHASVGYQARSYALTVTSQEDGPRRKEVGVNDISSVPELKPTAPSITPSPIHRDATLFRRARTNVGRFSFPGHAHSSAGVVEAIWLGTRPLTRDISTAGRPRGGQAHLKGGLISGAG